MYYPDCYSCYYTYADTNTLTNNYNYAHIDTHTYTYGHTYSHTYTLTHINHYARPNQHDDTVTPPAGCPKCRGDY